MSQATFVFAELCVFGVNNKALLRVLDLGNDKAKQSSGSENQLNSCDSLICNADFLADVIRGLGQRKKALSCKYFYDERGSQLFDEICCLEEYYLTRTEQRIMDRFAGEMADQLGEGVMLIEFGSGSSTKTRVLLERLNGPAGYVPIDISEAHLIKTAEALRTRFPEIEILPLVADFTSPFTLPIPDAAPSHNAVYFPGSTIGNFEPDAALRLLRNMADILGENGGLLIGIDLQKDSSIIHDAYNDSRNVTAEFNLNLLHRMNSELGANFEIDQFRHLADYNTELGRVEIFIVSQCRQVVTVADQEFVFGKGEKIFTEYSHKYTIYGFARLAARAGFALHKSWTDTNDYFAVLHLVLEKTNKGAINGKGNLEW